MKGEELRGGRLHEDPVRGPSLEHCVSDKYGHGWETSLIWEMKEFVGLGQ